MISAILGIVGGMAPFLMKLGLWWLERTGAKVEAKQKFLADFSAMQSKTDSSLAAKQAALSALSDMEKWQAEQRLPPPAP